MTVQTVASILEHGIRRQERLLVTAGKLVGASQADEPGLLLVEKVQDELVLRSGSVPE